MDNLVLARFCEHQPPQEQNLTVVAFNNLRFKPDLVFYLIAPDKQFGRGDRKYLKDLLKKHQKVIYVLNLFVNKQNQEIYMATEANLVDVITKIISVHTSVLGEANKPIIVGVNCWTGEGISELVTCSHELLSTEKGNLLEALIDYQQQKTPDDYVVQVKQELLRLFAYAACQKPEGNYSCQQPLHEASHALLQFLTDLRKQSERAEYSVGEQVNILTKHVLEESLKEQPQQKIDDDKEDREYITHGMLIISAAIDYINGQIMPPFLEAQAQAMKFKGEEIKSLEQRVESLNSTLNSLWSEMLSHIEKYRTLDQETDDSAAEINSRRENQNSRVQSYNSLQAELMVRANQFNSREERWKSRLDNYNYAVDRINSGRVIPTRETINSLESDLNYLKREQDSINAERSSLRKQIESLENKEETIKRKETAIQKKIERHNAKMDVYRQEKETIRNQLKGHAERKKAAEDEIGFYVAAVQNFETDFNSIDEKVNSRIDEINARINEVRQRFLQSLEEDIHQNRTTLSTQEIASCITEMNSLVEEVQSFRDEVETCVTKLAINKLVGEISRQATIHHFDDTGEFEYKGSTYNYFYQPGITLLLTLAHLIMTGWEITSEYRRVSQTISTRVNRLGHFPNTPSENEILKILGSKINLLFDASFEEEVRKVAM